MAEPILMTALSPTMTDGSIAQWLAKEGQALKSGDALCEVETDKATMTYEAPVSGTLLKIIAEANTAAVVGQLIAVMGKPGESWEEIASSATIPAASPAPAEEAEESAPAPAVPAAKPSPAPAPAPAAAQTAASPLAPGLPRSSPLARKLAKEKNLDLRQIQGSGPGGRIVVRDLEQVRAAPAPRAPVSRPAPAARAAVSRPAAGATSNGLRGDRVPLSKMRTIIASRLSESYSQAPHYFVRIAIDMERLFALRKELNGCREQSLSLNAFLIKLSAIALERHPDINASWEGDAIQYLPAADIGLAVALEGGLITPVVRTCESKGLEAIDGELGGLVARARTGELLPEEYTGASFTISNLGAYGVEEFTAILNPPGSAILALGAVAEEAVVRDGAVVPRRILHATLSADHRVIDGAQAAAFMAELKALYEEPGWALR
jgi:pyruvate dehydrogenase E2 component (dihydrolipoyllysine-residue acetyltransferase)